MSLHCRSRTLGFDKIKIDRALIEKRKELSNPKGYVPDGTKWITIGVDVGKYRCHWVAIAWVLTEESRKGVVIDYGTIDMKMQSGGQSLTAKELGFDQLFAVCMRDFKTQVDGGWRTSEGEMRSYDAMWIDARWAGRRGR